MQTEVFLEFQQVHPEVKVKQRKVESLKPLLAKQATERDRTPLLCRKLVETKGNARELATKQTMAIKPCPEDLDRSCLRLSALKKVTKCFTVLSA